MKYSDRVENYPISKLTSGFQSFAVQYRKRKNEGKYSPNRQIFKEGVLKLNGGSKNKCPKSQQLKPFKPKEPSRKRPHYLPENTPDNKPAPKKVDRSI